MKLLRSLLFFCAPLLCAAQPTVVSLFPTDELTVPDATQATGLRVTLPYACLTLPGEPPNCPPPRGATAVDQLDGFSLNPRIAVQFSGPVDTDTLRSTIFITAADTPFDVISINQVIYDPQTFTVYAKPDRVLDQQRKYRLIVASENGIIASTTFTTLSATTWLERARGNLTNIPPSLALTAAYNFSDLTSFTLHQQTHANPSSFQDTTLPIGFISGVGAIAFASFISPTYLNAGQTIDPIPTGADPGPGLGTNQLYFHALLPATPKPPGGYPVIIYGHGLGDSQYGGSSAVAPIMASNGFAIVAINAVGHGYGPQSTVVIGLKNGQQVQLPAGGRSIPDATGAIQSDGGCVLVNAGLGLRDCLRQTALDLMQLVRMLKSGVDLDGDGTVDLDPNRIYYTGQSLGSLYGTLLTAIETNLPVVTLNAGGGSVIDIARWSPAFHGLLQQALAANYPTLLNEGSDFNENYVLRDQPVKVNDVAGAIQLQNYFELLDWANFQGDPLPFATLLRPSPIKGFPGKTVLFQFAIGDETVPNPTESALVRAADMQQSTWVFRNDLPGDPHAYLTNVLSGGLALSIALATQIQIAGFFSSNGTTIPDPNASGLNYFAVPTTLPETLGFQ